jgi:hypothetical protein
MRRLGHRVPACTGATAIAAEHGALLQENTMTATILAPSLSGNDDPAAAVLAGVVGARRDARCISGGLAMGMTRMDLRTLGTMFIPDGSKQTVYAIGLLVHLMMGAIFGLIHAGILTAFDPSTDGGATVLGLVVGVIYGLLVMVMPMMLNMTYPLVRRGDIHKPGVALTGFGTLSPMGVAVAHAAFGLVAGAIYVGVVG